MPDFRATPRQFPRVRGDIGLAVSAASSAVTRRYPRSRRSCIEAQTFLRPLQRDPAVPIVVPLTYARRYPRRRENARRLELALTQTYLLAERARSWVSGRSTSPLPWANWSPPAAAAPFIGGERRVRVRDGGVSAVAWVGLRASGATRARGRSRSWSSGRVIRTVAEALRHKLYMSTKC